MKKIVEILQRHAKRELKVAIKEMGVPLYTDARHYSAAGIPTVLYGAGPRSILEANAHSAQRAYQAVGSEGGDQDRGSELRDMLRA